MESLSELLESGRGKTSLINILLGQIIPSSGEIFIDNNLASPPFFGMSQ